MINNNAAVSSDQVKPETVETMRVIFEGAFNEVFSDSNKYQREEYYSKIIKPYLDQLGIKEKTPLAIAYEMFVLGFDSGMDFYERINA